MKKIKPIFIVTDDSTILGVFSTFNNAESYFERLKVEDKDCKIKISTYPIDWVYVLPPKI
jgi:hypothetical protein